MSAYLQTMSCMAQSGKYIVAMGDSRTASKTGAWGGYPIANLAIDGATTTSLISTQLPLLPALVSQNVLLYWLDVGVNDTVALVNDTMTMAQFEANAQTILQTILGAGVPAMSLLVSTTVPAGTYPGVMTPTDYWTPTVQIASVWQSLCAPLGVRTLDLLGAFTNGQYTPANIVNAYFNDPLSPGAGHYSPAGWALVDDLVENMIPARGPLGGAWMSIYEDYEDCVS